MTDVINLSIFYLSYKNKTSLKRMEFVNNMFDNMFDNAIDNMIDNVIDGMTASIKNKIRDKIITFLAPINLNPDKILNTEKKLILKWKSCDNKAQAPFKNNLSDSGYDLTAIGISKKVNNIYYCDTGIQIEPPTGWYFDLVPRSSICFSGYIMPNSIGIIDQDYRGNILIPLMKVDKNSPELKFPLRIAQLIPREVVEMKIVKKMTLSKTVRGSNNFGSSNKHI